MTIAIDTTPQADVAAAAARLDGHLREIIRWHFSPETGTPYWLDWARSSGFNPLQEIETFADLQKFPHFSDEALRDEPHQRWIPKPYEGRPYKIFETGGTTGMPKQRISWEDHEIDYTEFSETLDDEYFPPGGNWLLLGPTGPRRLRVTIEHLANFRGGSCYYVDLDPRWVKKLLANKKSEEARQYMDHVIDQAIPILENRKVSILFSTPKLLEALGERLSVPGVGIRGVFLGGTSMTNQVCRFLSEEVLEGKAQLVPTYGNTLMGLASSKTLSAEDGYALTYYAPQPRALLRVVNPQDTDRTVDYGEWGRVELSTLTKEFFMPRFLERDEAIRRPPINRFPWDGVGEVRPFGTSEKKVVEGVY